MTHSTCKLTAKNRDQLQNPTLGNRVRATFMALVIYICFTSYYACVVASCVCMSQCTFTTTHVLYHGHQWCVVYKYIYTARQKKGTTFLLWINLLICNVIWQHLLLKYIAIDVTSLISGIYTNFHTFLCKKCDVRYYVYQSNNEVDVIIVSVSLLHKILNARQN